jgi:hypothetical protein
MSDSPIDAPAGLLVPPAAAVGFVAAVGMGTIAPIHSWWAFAVLLLCCAVTSTISSVGVAPVIGVLWALCADGFVAHRFGRLVPVGPGDLGWLGAFVAAALLGAWCRLPPALVRHHVDAVLGRPRERTLGGLSTSRQRRAVAAPAGRRVAAGAPRSRRGASGRKDDTSWPTSSMRWW